MHSFFCYAFSLVCLTLIFYLKYLSIMTMKNEIAKILLATEMLGGMGNMPDLSRLSSEPPNGNSRRTHKSNLKRRKLRRISGSSKNLTHKNKK